MTGQQREAGARAAAADAAVDGHRTESRVTPRRASAIVAVVGLLITGSLAWTAWTLDRHNEQRLLEVQGRQAAEVINSTVLAIRDPLATSLEVSRVSHGDPVPFQAYLVASVGPTKLFVSAVLWRAAGGSYVPVTTVGVPPLLLTSSRSAQDFVDRAVHSPTFVVLPEQSGTSQRIAYAIADPSDPTYVVVAERAIPASRVVSVEKNPAFANLDFATHLGSRTDATALATTDVPPDQLPISGRTTRVSIPFGDTTITLVAAPRTPLGGSFGGNLVWILLVGGLLLTAATAVIAAQLVTRRRAAEGDARTISGLYGTLDTLYGQQRSIAETLQRALLPQRNPAIPRLESATRYVPGADGMEVGGDWFSVIEIDDHRFAFSVGDVSGKGVSAAAIMARLRFTIRAYVTEGHAPDVVLQMCSRQLDVTRDGHLSTVLVGVGDLVTGEIVLANAGHLNPMVVTAKGAEFVKTTVGLPLGVTACTYVPTMFRLPPGASFVAFTDGLVERRGESIDVGLARLAEAVSAASPDTGPERLLSTLVTAMADDRADDDVTLLAFTWTSGS